MSVSENHKMKSDSKKYHNHTNKSFKKLTDREKKAFWFLSTVKKLRKKSDVLKDLRIVTNEILSNCAYHEKNLEVQFRKLESMKVPKKELEVISKAWDLKNKLGKSLMDDLEEFLNDCEKEYNNT